MRMGIDAGGTFTDFVVAEKSGIRVLKVFSTRDDPARSILDGIEKLGPVEAYTILHGTTVATNSLLERRGSPVALVTTAGFEDLIEIGRQNRADLYSFSARQIPPLVPRPLRFGVRERTAADGRILLAPSASEITHIRRRIKNSGARSIALCFLFSFTNPRNERLVAKGLRTLGLPVSVSHEILPEFREYERLSTIAINAYLAPLVGRYLKRLGDNLSGDAGKNQGVAKGSRLFIMQSSGGVTTDQHAATEPVRTILSGPAGGVVAARRLADHLGIRRAISFDMGGTSTDVCLLDGPPRTTNETTLGGLPVAIPVLDVLSVGAGGGSLARIDAGGALRVGPESAGATPGPICYGRGGSQPTVTDANVVLGRLDRDLFLGGGFQLDPQKAERAFREFLRGAKAKASPGGSFNQPFELAQGIIAVSNAAMEKALRVISVERGHDPRDFSLICFGGAGGLHAAALARALGMKQVIVPPNPGAFSALGILLSDFAKDVSQSILMRLPVARESRADVSGNFVHELERRFGSLERKGRAELRKDRIPNGRMLVERRVDLRYTGQSYEISVPFSPRFAEYFHREHAKAYGYRDINRSVEVVNLRLRIVVATPKPAMRRVRNSAIADASAAIIKHKPVWIDGRRRQTCFYDRTWLSPGIRFDGPAVVAEYSSTTLVPPGCECRVDHFLNLVLTDHAR